MSDLEQLAGQQINDRFTLERPIGRGASGVVYRARDSSGRRLALKLLNADTGTERSSARYLRGTRLASQLEHPHIVRILESGRWGDRRGAYYLAMELVEGVSLTLMRHAGLSPASAVGLIGQVLDAAVYVHARGTLHRDLKPDNVMISRTGGDALHCRVTDFGIASNRLHDATITLQGSVIGPPAYMAPEQAQGLPSMGPSADLYAIGVMLYELLCGELPFHGAVQAILYEKIRSDPPQLPNAESLPDGLADMVMKLIARKPEDRFFHARDAWEELQVYAEPPVLSKDVWENLVDLGGVHPSVFDLDDTHDTHVDSSDNQTWQMVRAVEPSSGTWLGDPVPSRLWGREMVMRQLDGFSRRVEEGVGQVVLISAGLGLGKSVVLGELAIQLQEQGRFQVVRTSFSSTSPLDSGLRGAVEQSLGVRGRSEALLTLAVSEHLRRFGEDDPKEQTALVEWLRPLVHTAGEEPLSQASNFAPGLRYLRRLARERPVLLLLDDLHHGGGDAAALIEFLLFELDFEPCDLLVLGALDSGDLTPDFSDGLGRSAHAEGRSRHIVQLAALSTTEITRGLRGELELSTAQAERIADRAGGNPLIARELARSVSQSGGLSDSLVSSAFHAKGVDAVLDVTLRRIMRSLLAAADDSEGMTTMLQAMAILGEEVDVDVLARFLDTPLDDAEFETMLDTLIERDVLEEIRMAGRDRVALRPRVLAQVVLAEMGRRQRRRLHRRALEILSDSERVDPGVLGDHHRALDEIEPALEYWKRAESRALLAGAPFVACEWGVKIIESIAEPDRSIWGVRVGRILLDSGDPLRAEKILRPLVDVPWPDLGLLAGDVLCDVYENLGKGSEWTALTSRLEEMLPHAQRSGRHAALCALAMWRTSHGNDQAGLEAAQEALELSESPVEVRRAAQRLAFSCLPSLQLERASAAAEKALDASGEHPQQRARSLRTLGVVRMWQGRGEEAIDLHEKALALARWKGLSSRAALALQDLGDALRVSGSYSMAGERYASCIQAAEAQDLNSTVHLVRFKQLMCEIAQGVDMSVVDRIQRMVQPAVEAGLGLAVPFADLLIAWSLAGTDRREEAREALDRARSLEGFQVDPQVPAIFAEIRAQLGEE